MADLFLWQSFTGQSWADVVLFNRGLINWDNPKMPLLIYQRGKNGIEAIVPLEANALSILEKYPEGLPKISGQKYNAYLKEIAEIIGIDKRLTSHMARRTFATNMINERHMPYDIVAGMLGHTNSSTTKLHYARISPQRFENLIAS